LRGDHAEVQKLYISSSSVSKGLEENPIFLKDSFVEANYKPEPARGPEALIDDEEDMR
jgi:hypothetical protein